MSFDTTASNSGIRAGATVLIEKKLGKRLLHLACRHHIFEVILGDVFNSLAGPSTGPDILLFKRFQTAWPTMDSDNIANGLSDVETAAAFSTNQQLVDDAVLFAQEILQDGDSQPRDDYRELLEISLIYMGHLPPRGMHLLAPGAVHRARWMSKAIYSLKIFLYRSQFTLTVREAALLRSFNLFICLVYLKAWFTAPQSVEAPLNDLMCVERLYKFRAVNPKVAKVALNALSRHTWYLSEELIAFSFFDQRIEDTVKTEMLHAMKTKAADKTISSWRPQHSLDSKTTLKITDLVSTSTTKFFEILEIPTGWIDKETALWKQDSEYLVAKSTASNLSVINDRAERGVALIQEYNQILTKDEDQKQALLHIVSAHRKQYPNCNKSTLAK
jgi:hypothetical protein